MIILIYLHHYSKSNETEISFENKDLVEESYDKKQSDIRNA